jgi:hypothetical protein
LKRSPSLGSLAPFLGSLAVARTAIGTSSTMAAGRRRSWCGSLLCSCCAVTRRRDAEEGHKGGFPVGGARLEMRTELGIYREPSLSTR